MLELFAAVSLLAVLCLALCIYIIFNLRNERDEALQDLTIQRGDVRSLTTRCTNLRGEVIAQQKSIDLLREGHDRLVAERDEAVRAMGRLRAEQIAAKPKRGPGGKFIAKSKKSETAKPIACG